MDPSQVVRIFATTQEPDYESPWQTNSPASSTGSGVLLGPDRVLTGAHVVADATFLQVQTVFDPEKTVATVEAVCHDADLALLRVSAPFEDVEPAALGELPARRDRVSVVGFPIGGEEVSITEGVVSRLEVQEYTHSQRHLLAITVDAAINEGNSGGPVFHEGLVVGIAFQGLDDAENIGEAVPATLIRRFLEGVEEGRPLEVPGFGVSVQNLENPRLRQHLRMEEGESGLLVTNVEYGGSAWGVVQPGDVLLRIDGVTVANNGTVQENGIRTHIEVLLGERFVGDDLPVTLRREAERIETVLELRPASDLVPRSRYGVIPTYLVFGGLVFQPLTRDFLRTWDDWRDRAPRELLALYYLGHRSEERREVIVLSQVLASDLTIGYGPLYWDWVDKIDGEVPRDMADFARRIDGATGTLELTMSSKARILLDVDEARAVHEKILTRYRIPADRSTNLRAPASDAG